MGHELYHEYKQVVRALILGFLKIKVIFSTGGPQGEFMLVAEMVFVFL